MTDTSVIAEPAQITPGWLTKVLAAAGFDASVRDVAVSAVGTGQMAACYRIAIRYGGGEGPASLIAKVPSSNPSVRSRAALTYRTEVSFYRDFAPALSVAVPRCYLAAITKDAGAFTLLLEDMAPAAAGDQLTGCTAAQALDAARAVAALHAGSWCDATLGERGSLIPRTIDLLRFTAPRMPELLAAFVAKRELEDETLEVLDFFARNFTSWAAGRTTPFSLVHNDFRLDNLLFDPRGGTVTTVDWQSLSTGMPLRDVAFLVGTGLDQESRRNEEHGIVSAYHDSLLGLGVGGYSFGQCWDDYRHSLFHGPYICLLADGIAEPTERGLRMFTVMAERSAAAIRELDSFGVV